MRSFEGGATRDDEAGKLDPDGFLSPLALAAYFKYMHHHRIQADGATRESDNWQRQPGIPFAAFMKSGWRHFFDWWTRHKMWENGGRPASEAELDALRDALCAVIFNTFGYLHKLEVGRAASHRGDDAGRVTWTPGVHRAADKDRKAGLGGDA